MAGTALHVVLGEEAGRLLTSSLLVEARWHAGWVITDKGVLADRLLLQEVLMCSLPALGTVMRREGWLQLLSVTRVGPHSCLIFGIFGLGDIVFAAVCGKGVEGGVAYFFIG